MIIDMNVHVTPHGEWLNSRHSADEDELLVQLDDAGVDKAALVGIPDFSPTDFVLDVCRRHPERLVPVGSFNPVEYSFGAVAKGARDMLMDRGLVGVKLHPRLGQFDLLDPRIGAFLEEIESWAVPLKVWICTLLHYRGGKLSASPVEVLHRVVSEHPSLTFILAHAGGPHILALASAIRDCPNVSLDLSWTLVKYAGSSLDLDISYLANTFDRRMVFGSDFPEVRVGDAVGRLMRLLEGAKPEARTSLLSTNAARILGIDV